MLKVYIIGGSGSGKSTLARDLSARLQIPHHELDKIGWKNGGQWAAYVDDAMAIAEQAGWIAEGNYIIWTDPLFYQADYIVWLEISWPVAVWRIVSRHILNSLRGINPYPGINGVKLLFKLLKGTRKYYLDNAHANPAVAKAVREYLDEHEADMALADTETLIARWRRCVKVIPFTADFVRMYLEKYQGKVLFIRNDAERERVLRILMPDEAAV